MTADNRVTLTAYLHESIADEIKQLQLRGAVVVLPGGGYRAISESEADPIALRYLAAGYHAFVLRYSIGEYASYPAPLIDASRAIAIIRNNAAQWGLDEQKIAVCGMSAGGHLTASLGTLWHETSIIEAANIGYGDNKPNGLILGYPVITYTGGNHQPLTKMWGSVSSEQALPEMQRKLSCEQLVTKDTPPCFIFHTFEDQVVPVQHSLLFSQALAEEGIPFELHIYPKGRHGLSLATDVTARGQEEWKNDVVAQWMDASCRWLDSLFASAR